MGFVRRVLVLGVWAGRGGDRCRRASWSRL